MNYAVIGSCSCCGGHVTVPKMWWGINPPDPTCEKCHAVMRRDMVIDMIPRIDLDLEVKISVDTQEFFEKIEEMIKENQQEIQKTLTTTVRKWQ